MKKPNPHQGSRFADFLHTEGIYEEVEAAALKKVIAMTLSDKMRKRHLSVSKLAKALGTSRAAVNRVLDESNTSITLHTISRMASALGCRIRLEIASLG